MQREYNAQLEPSKSPDVARQLRLSRYGCTVVTFIVSHHFLVSVLIFLQADLKELLQASSEPIATVCLMIPAENVVLVNLSVSVNRECKVIATDMVTKKEQVIEGHI